MVKLVIPHLSDPNKTINGLHEYGHSLYSLIPMDDWGNEFLSIEAPSMTFEKLCDKYRLTDIQFLQIDTEGYDSEIIKSIDFSKINIDVP